MISLGSRALCRRSSQCRLASRLPRLDSFVSDETASTVVFLGGGKMAEAMIGGMQVRAQASADLASPEISVIDPNEARRDHLSHVFSGISSFKNPEACPGLASADVVVLAVKPQTTEAVFSRLPQFSPRTMLLSIVAGLTIEQITEGTGISSIVRAMPNTPAMIGAGISCWTTSDSVEQNQREAATELLQSFGKEVFVSEEDWLDMATAVSGSGPAYVFTLMESMEESAVHLGMSRSVARQLVNETVRGSALYAIQSERHPVELRNDITSPGGTTAAGLYHLEQVLKFSSSRALTFSFRVSDSEPRGAGV